MPIFSFLFSTTNLEALSKFACQIFYICQARRVWLNSVKLEERYVRNLKFRMWKHDMPCVLQKVIMTEVSGHKNVFHDVSSILYMVTNIYPKAEILLKCYQCFLFWKLIFIHVKQHSQHPKKRKSRKSMKGNGRFKAARSLNRSKDTQIELTNKEIWRKRKEKSFNRRNWLIHNVKVIEYCCWETSLIRIPKLATNYHLFTY